MPIALTPVPVQLQGSVLVNGSAVLSHPVTVTAVPLGNGAVGSATQTDSNGGYGFGLVPGTYALVVDENVSSTRAMRSRTKARTGSSRRSAKARCRTTSTSSCGTSSSGT